MCCHQSEGILLLSVSFDNAKTDTISESERADEDEDGVSAAKITATLQKDSMLPL